MAYVPPHRRHNGAPARPSPSPEPLPPPQWKKKDGGRRRRKKIIYADHAFSTWFPVGMHMHEYDEHHYHQHEHHPSLPPLHLHLRPISLESVERKIGEKPLILVNTTTTHSLDFQVSPFTFSPHTPMKSPPQIITHNVLPHLLSAFQHVRSHMHMQLPSPQLVRPTLVARFGKLLFHGRPLDAQEAMQKGFASGINLKRFKRSFYTNIPTLYMEKISRDVSSNIGFDFEEEKDVFHVKLSDANRPDATISCKCRLIKEHNRLEMYKIELNQVRHMVTDISSLTKNLDLRLMLCSKRILTALKDGEMQCIQGLIHSATLDLNVKGGLRWALGKRSSGDRFSVVGVWHTIAKAYRTPSLRLKVRHADRFDFRTSTGESASEVYLKLKGIVSELQVDKVDIGLISEMLEHELKMIWDHFLNCEHFLG